MSPSQTFILRPVATSLLMVGILLAGGVAYKQLPVSALPEVDYPTIQVVTFYPGASPDVMASSVTAPLERQFGQVPGLQQMTSTSSDGSSVITLQFNLSLNIDVAEQEVQQSINASGTFLPPDLPTPPLYSKTNPADTPILTLALTSKTLALAKVEDVADTRLAPKISQLPGVGLVSISGGQKPAVRIQANPTQLGSYGLNLEDVRNAITAANVNQAKGNFDGQYQDYQIGANDQLLSSADYASLIIAYRNGAPVKLTDVAMVKDDIENLRQAAWWNLTPAVILNIQRQPGANIIAVVDRIKALLPHSHGHAAVGRACAGADRPHQHHPRLGERRAVRADAYRRAGGDGDLPVPAQPLRHDHSQHCGAAFAHRHVRRDVPAGIQPEQPDPDGADHLDWLRGGRRHRDDRKHQPLYRRGRDGAAGGVEGFGADRIHHRVAHHFADRGADSAVVHGRYRGPAVPRIRGHAGRNHSGFGGGFADADAHDVLQAAEAYAGAPAGLVLPCLGARLQLDHRSVWQDAAGGAALSNRSPCWWRSDAGAHRAAVPLHPQGLLSDSGYGRDPGDFGSGADHLFPRNVEAAILRWRK